MTLSKNWISFEKRNKAYKKQSIYVSRNEDIFEWYV